jgi:hypothetical protein
MNEFKLKFLNDTLKKITAILGDAHRPFPDCETFDTATMPSASDVVLMLSHYLRGMDTFHAEHTYRDSVHGRLWHTKDVDDITDR